MTIDIRHKFPANEYFDEFVACEAETEIPGGFHKGHINLHFHHNPKIEQLNMMISHLPGVDRTEIWAHNTAIMVSIHATGDTAAVSKEIAKLLLEDGLISHEETGELFRAIDGKMKMQNREAASVRTL